MKKKINFFTQSKNNYAVLTRKKYPKRKNYINDGAIRFRFECMLHMRAHFLFFSFWIFHYENTKRQMHS